MLIELNKMEDTILHEFNGGNGDVIARMFFDGKNRIMRATLKKGSSIGRHTHSKNFEVLYVLQGTCKVTLNDTEELFIEAGNIHFCPRGNTHMIEQYGEEDLVILAVVPAKNDVEDTIINRRSCKQYDPKKPVPKELIERVVNAGAWAATGKGAQAPIILAVTNKDMRNKLSKMNAKVLGADGDPFYGAPVVLVVLSDKDACFTWKNDGSIVIANMMLMAEDLGLGSCWVHRCEEEFNTEEGKAILKELGIEGNYEGIGHCILGYPKGEKREAQPRKDNYVYWVE